MLLAAQVFVAVVVFAVIVGFLLTSPAFGGYCLASMFHVPSLLYGYAAMFYVSVVYIFSRIHHQVDQISFAKPLSARNSWISSLPAK
jgi:hypothetical protein